MVAKSIAKMYTNIHKPTDYWIEPKPHDGRWPADQNTLQLPLSRRTPTCVH